MDTLQEWLALLGPNVYIQAAAIVVGSIVAGKLVDWIISGIVRRWARRTTTDFDDRLIEIMHRPLTMSVVLAGLALATVKLDLGEPYAWATLAALKTIAIYVWLAFGLRFVGIAIALLSRHEDRFPLFQSRTAPLLENVGLVLLVGAGVYFVFLAWNIDVTAWLASAGIVGIAVGFAAKDTLANLFAGVFILVDAPYKVGDFVMLDSGERGRITQIGLRSTRLLTRDDIEITIPNSVMGNTKIVNESGGPHEKERIRVRVGVAYGTDIDLVRATMIEIAHRHPEICEDPEPRVRFRSFGNSGLDFELLVWIDEPVLRGRLLDALNCEVYKEFGLRGIEIPFPKHDVYIRQAPPPPGPAD
jgi:small-conductance mechanosensitive channel